MTTFAETMKSARLRHSGSDLKSEGKRFREVLAILRKHDLKRGISPESAVEVLQDLGPTFVKLGQIASSHPDMLPAEYCRALGVLRSNAAPLEVSLVRTQVESELGRPIGEVFLDFDERALGSASIAQVHRARLLDGTQVAVKIRRPGVVETVTEDLAIMERVADLSLLVKGEGGMISLKDLVSEMVRTSTNELDFTNEMASIERFYSNCQGRAGVTCPRCHGELCTPALIVEDLVTSPTVDSMVPEELDAIGREGLSYRIAENYLQQVMEDGFFHADPHAGNIAVSAAGEICWMDFGMMGEVSPTQRSVLREMMGALRRGDTYSLKRALLRMAVPTCRVDQSELLVFCEDLVGMFADADLESFDAAALCDVTVRGLQGRGLKVEPYLTNLSRGLVTLEGTIGEICPQLSIMTVVSEYLASSLSIDNLGRKAKRAIGRGVEGAEALADLPSKAVDTLDMVQKGQVKIGLDLPMTEAFDKEIRGVGAILALSFIASALVIGACILGASGRGLYIGGVSIEGGFGLVLGAVMLVFVFVKSWKYIK